QPGLDARSCGGDGRREEPALGPTAALSPRAGINRLGRRARRRQSLTRLARARLWAVAPAPLRRGSGWSVKSLASRARAVHNAALTRGVAYRPDTALSFGAGAVARNSVFLFSSSTKTSAVSMGLGWAFAPFPPRSK